LFLSARVSSQTNANDDCGVTAMEHRQQTDQIKKIQLPSSLERVAWTKRTASADALVGFEILTSFVGNGSQIEIELSDHTGKRFGKYKERICGNRFWAQIKIPSEAKEALYADVKLPKHGLQMKSGPLIVLPAVDITNAKWDKKEARRGDILKLTADVKGIPDGTEGLIEIWEHDDDGAHDFITKFPVLVKDKKVEAEWEYEYYEDTDEIPTENELEKGYNPPEYFFRVNIGGVQADSGLLVFKDWITVSLNDSERRRIPDEEYTLYLPDGSEKRGRLNSEGLIEIKDVPPGRYYIEFSNKKIIYSPFNEETK